MTPSSRWPTDEELRLLLAGDLETHRAAEIEALLEREEVLREQLERIAGGASWGNQARVAEELPSVDPALQAAMAHLKQPQTAATIAQDSPSGPMPLSFLAPAKNADALGNLAHYEVQEIIGAGGFGTVLKAYDPKLNRYVAIKVLSPHLAAHATARQRFLREAHAAGGVSNDHVVTIYAIEEAHQPPYIVMEYVPGLSLQQLIDRDGPLSVSKIVRIGAQAAEGLAAAHQKGLIHRDIKPANILLENGVQRVKLTDFGLARLVDDAALTQSGVVAGTPQYMSPEQALGQPVDYRSDLFSLGSVLYTMCTGRPAFRADSAVAVLKRVCDDQPRPVREVNPEIPAWLAAIVDKLMAKKPEQRFASAIEVRDLLERCLAYVQQPHLAPLPETAVRLIREPERVALQPLSSHDSLELARAKVRPPAIGLTVIAIVNWFMIALIGVFLMGNGFYPPAWVLGLLLLLYTSAAMLLAGASVAMRQLRYWPLAVAASMAVMVIGPGSVIGLFVGIWSLIVLLQRDVREAFAAVAAGQATGARGSHPSIAKKPPVTPVTPYAPQAASGAGWGLVAVLALVGGGLLAGCAGLPLLWFFSVSKEPAMVTQIEKSVAWSSCRLTVQTELPNIQISIQGTGSATYEKHSFATPQDGMRQEFTQQRPLPAGTYYVAAWDSSTREQIFERLVSLREGEQTTVRILPQALHPKTTAMRPKPNVHHSEIVDVIVSPDGSRVAWNVKDESVYVFDAVTGNMILRTTNGDPRVMAFSGDGKKFAMATKNQGAGELVTVFDLAAPRETTSLKLQSSPDSGSPSPTGPIDALTFSSDGQVLLGAASFASPKETETDPEFKSVIYRWQVSDGTALPPLRLQDGRVTKLIVPAKKQDVLFALSRTSDKRSELALWSLESATTIAKVATSEESLIAAAASPQGGWIYGALELHHQRRGFTQETRSWLTRKSPGSDQRGLWTTPKVLQLGPVRAMAVSPDGKLLAIATEDRNVRLFDATDPATTVEVGAAVGPESHYLFDLAFTPDSRSLVGGTTIRNYRWDVSRWTKPRLALEAESPAAPGLQTSSVPMTGQERKPLPTLSELLDESAELAAQEMDRVRSLEEQGLASASEVLQARLKWLVARLNRAEQLSDPPAIRNNLESLVELSREWVELQTAQHQQGAVTEADVARAREQLVQWEIRAQQAGVTPSQP